jgi:hypothetical protein
MKHVIQSISVAITGTGHTANFTTTGDISGKVWYAVLTIPDYTNTVNSTLTVQNQESRTIFTAAAVAKNTTTTIVYPGSAASTTTPFPIMPNYQFTITTGGATGGTSAYTVYLDMWIE